MHRTNDSLWCMLTVFLAATAALEVQKLVCVSVCVSVTLATTVLKEFWRTSKGLLTDFQRTSWGLLKEFRLWTLWSTKFTSFQVAAPRSSRLVIQTIIDWKLDQFSVAMMMLVYVGVDKWVLELDHNVASEVFVNNQSNW